MPAKPPTIDAAALKHFDEQGYVILRGAFSPARIASLLSAIERVMQAGREGRCKVGWFDAE